LRINLPAHRDNAQGALQMIGVDRNIRIIEVNFKAGTPFTQVRERASEGATG
jgi:hypothetical protein